MAASPQEGCALLLGVVVRSVVRSAVLSGAASPSSAGGIIDPAPAPPRQPGIAAAALEIRLIWPCLNVWAPESERTRRFRLDPREQLLAQRWGRDHGLQVLGAAHSHPASAARPSATDLELSMAPTLQLILSPLADWEPACWWLEHQEEVPPMPRPLRWRMVD